MLVAVTILLATFATSIIIIVNEDMSRFNRFSYRLRNCLSDMSQLLADYQFSAIEASKKILSAEEISSVMYSIQNYDQTYDKRISIENDNKELSGLLQMRLKDSFLDSAAIYDSNGENIAVFNKQYEGLSAVSSPRGAVAAKLDSAAGDDLFYFDVNDEGELRIVLQFAVYHRQADSQKLVGYLRTCKKIDGSFSDEIKKLNGVELEYMYIEDADADSVIRNVWGIKKVTPVLFPFTDVSKEHIVFDDGSAQLVQRWILGQSRSVYFHLLLPGYMYPLSLANMSVLFVSVFLLMILLLIPFWWFFMRHAIVRPIERLLDISNKVKQGRYDECEYAESSFDEYHDLEMSFSSMVCAIRQREKQLDEINRQLADKVEAETAKRIKNEQIMLEQKKFADMGQMINAIAHQWRQPLNGLSLVVQNICEEASEGRMLQKDIDENKGMALQLIMHMSKTIDDFRKFFSSSKDIVEYDAVGAVCEVISMIRPQMKNNGIVIIFKCNCNHKSYECCDSTPEPDCEMSENIVKGIPGELKQAILNLIQNARDAIEEKMNKSGNVQGLIEVELDCCDSNIRILVRDNGTGIPEEILTDIFNPYFTTKTEGKGTGIGLYMTKIVIKDNLGGEISAFNHEGGAAFEVLIPKEFKGSRS